MGLCILLSYCTTATTASDRFLQAAPKSSLQAATNQIEHYNYETEGDLLEKSWDSQSKDNEDSMFHEL